MPAGPPASSSLAPASAALLLGGFGSEWLHHTGLCTNTLASTSSRWDMEVVRRWQGVVACLLPPSCRPRALSCFHLVHISLHSRPCHTYVLPHQQDIPCPTPTADNGGAGCGRGSAPGCHRSSARTAPRPVRGAAANASAAGHVQRVRGMDRAGGAVVSGSGVGDGQLASVAMVCSQTDSAACAQ